MRDAKHNIRHFFVTFIEMKHESQTKNQTINTAKTTQINLKGIKTKRLNL